MWQYCIFVINPPLLKAVDNEIAGFERDDTFMEKYGSGNPNWVEPQPNAGSRCRIAAKQGGWCHDGLQRLRSRRLNIAVARAAKVHRIRLDIRRQCICYSRVSLLV